MSKRDVRLPWPRSADDGTPLGVDLRRLHADVRKIVLKHFKSALAWVEADDLVQEVYLAIARKNTQNCAFDPRKASLGKYVWTVANSVVLNLGDKRKRGSHVVLSDVGDMPDAVCERTPEDDLIEAQEAALAPRQLCLPLARLGVSVVARPMARAVRRVKRAPRPDIGPSLFDLVTERAPESGVRGPFDLDLAEAA
ncbi:RNA polymerase sigma factor [Sorangium sp. So ce1667]